MEKLATATERGISKKLIRKSLVDTCKNCMLIIKGEIKRLVMEAKCELK